MPIFKNVAGQKWAYYAVDLTTGGPKTGDSANITLYVNKDGAGPVALSDASVTEISATNDAGSYSGNLAQAESNANQLRFSGKSSTPNVVIVPITIGTSPPNFTSLGITSGGDIAAVDSVTTVGTVTTVTNVTTVASVTAVSASGMNAIADAMLNRDMSLGVDSGSDAVRTPRQAWRMIRNKVDLTTGHVYKEDDATVSWSFGTTTNPLAPPITIFDPV